MPNIIVKKDPTDNNYYWYLVDDNGKETPITDTEGNKVKANGSDGKTPDLRINSDGYWEVSYDGINYTSLGVKATGENGEDANRVTQVIVNYTYGYVEFKVEGGGSFFVPLNQE